MPRRGNPARRHRTTLSVAAFGRVETGPDGHEYEVRLVPAAHATKYYRCPGCDHEIRSGTAHVVVWPADIGERGMEDRRHWHTTCWRHRATRSPTRKWS